MRITDHYFSCCMHNYCTAVMRVSGKNIPGDLEVLSTLKVSHYSTMGEKCGCNHKEGQVVGSIFMGNRCFPGYSNGILLTGSNIITGFVHKVKNETTAVNTLYPTKPNLNYEPNTVKSTEMKVSSFSQRKQVALFMRWCRQVYVVYF